MTAKDLGARIRAARAGRKVEALLQGSGIAVETWSRYESGSQGWPRTDRLIAIARILGVSPGALLSDAPLELKVLPDPNFEGARGRAATIRAEADALLRLLSPASAVPFATSAPPVVRIRTFEEVGPPKKKRGAQPDPEFVRLPLVSERMAAGIGTFPVDLDELRWFTFRRDWAALGPDADYSRYVLAELGNESVADSMSPKIEPRSMLLLDKNEGVRAAVETDRRPGMAVVDESTDIPAIALKWVEPIRDANGIRALRLRSENDSEKGGKYDPIVRPLQKGEQIQNIVRARLVWWATTA